jgi:hypothetical protein
MLRRASVFPRRPRVATSVATNRHPASSAHRTILTLRSQLDRARRDLADAERSLQRRTAELHLAKSRLRVAAAVRLPHRGEDPPAPVTSPRT